MWRRLLDTRAPAAVFLIRLMVGTVFVSEGIQKFLFPERLGAGRFAALTRLAAIPLLIDMAVAIVSTKLPILLGRGFWIFQRPKLGQYGLWSMLHESRTDLSMFLGLLFLLAVGAGAWSFDKRLTR